MKQFRQANGGESSRRPGEDRSLKNKDRAGWTGTAAMAHFGFRREGHGGHASDLYARHEEVIDKTSQGSLMEEVGGSA